MEQMVIGAVKGAPVTSRSRTDHFRSQTGAQTPRTRHFKDSGDGTHEEDDSGAGTDTTGEFNTEAGKAVSDSFNESDSSGFLGFQRARCYGFHSWESRISRSKTTEQRL